MMRKYICFFLVFITINIVSYSQTKSIFDNETNPVFEIVFRAIKNINDDIRKSKETIQKVKKDKRIIHSINDEISFKIALSTYYLIAENKDSLLFYSKTLLNEAKDIKDSNLIYRCYFVYSLNKSTKEDHDSSVFLLDKVLNYALRKKDTFAILTCTHNLMSETMRLGNYEQFYRYTKIRLNYLDTTENVLMFANTINLLGSVQVLEGAYLKGYKNHVKASKMYEDLKIKHSHAITQMNIGLIFMSLELFKEACYYFNKGLLLSFKVDNFEKVEAEFKMYIADCQLNLDSLEKARNNLNDALLIYEKNKSIAGLSNCYLIKSNLSYAFGDTTLAISYMKTASVLVNQLDRNPNLATHYLYSGSLNLKLGSIDKAIDDLTIALAYCTSNSTLKKGIYKLLAQAYAKKGNDEKFRYYQQQFESIVDESIDIVALKELFLINEEFKKEDNKHEQKRYWIYYLFLCLAFLLIISYLILKRKPEGNEVFFDKNKFIANIQKDKSFVSFMVEFEILFPGYLDEMKEKYENLTNNDIRVLALLKLNLKDKEIAQALSIQMDSVRKAKDRLNKKLNA